MILSYLHFVFLLFIQVLVSFCTFTTLNLLKIYLRFTKVKEKFNRLDSLDINQK